MHEQRVIPPMPKEKIIRKTLPACSGHTSATTWNSAKSEGTASDECAGCEAQIASNWH